MPSAPLIVWEKWVDPLGLEQEESYINEFFEDDQNDDNDSIDNVVDNFDDNKKPPKNMRVLSTPMGLIPMDQTLSAGKVFNFWVGYTNFNITKPIAYIIEKTNGVETLDIFTRYRFRIGVGKLFEDGEVMREINSRVYEHLL
jgi:hypothetical protein